MYKVKAIFSDNDVRIHDRIYDLDKAKMIAKAWQTTDALDVQIIKEELIKEQSC